MAKVTIRTPTGRFRWLQVFQAKQNMNGEQEKSGVLLIPKTSSLQTLSKARDTAAAEQWKGRIPASLRKLIGGQKPLLQDGDEILATKEEDKVAMYAAYKGCYVLRAACDGAVSLQLRNDDRTEILDPAELYDGCYGAFVISFETYEAKPRPPKDGKPGFTGGPMVSVKLRGVIKEKDGEPLSSATEAPMTDAEMMQYFGGAAAEEETI